MFEASIILFKVKLGEIGHIDHFYLIPNLKSN